MHHLVGGRPPGRATAGPVINDELFGLLFCHLRSHTLPVIGYEVGPIASNARHTFIHAMCDTNAPRITTTRSPSAGTGAPTRIAGTSATSAGGAGTLPSAPT